MEKDIFIEEKSRFCHINSTIEWDYEKDFLLALCNVDSGYYMYSVENSNKTKDKVYPERIFAYEFYHQYRKRMDQRRDFYEGKYLNGEQKKNRHVENYIGDYTPDLILHKKLDGMPPESQLWLCEIKMVESHDPLSDIEKFKKMDKLSFNDYVFLYAGSCLPNLLLRLYKKIKNGKISKESDGNCICICSYYSKTSKLYIECHRLYTLIDMIEEMDMESLRKQISRIKQISDFEVISEIEYTE